jgi:hypothetical protein
MDAPARVVHPLLVLALVLVAVCGYLAGSHRVSTAAAPQVSSSPVGSVTSSGLLLEYPLAWEQSHVAPSIPGLTVTHPVTLAPRGTTGTGLLSGLLPAGEPSPLPNAFLARLHGTPHAEVVALVSTQAFRYSRLQPDGYDGTLDVYVVPNGGEAPRIMACYAPRPLTPASQQCEQVVASVTPVGSTPSSLTPEPTYAAKLSILVSTLDQQRMQVRKKISGGSSAAAVTAPATSLAGRLSAASGQVSALEAPPSLALAQAALARALGQAGDAYNALAAASREESLAAYQSARAAVATAEKAVDAALEYYALLGYGGT